MASLPPNVHVSRHPSLAAKLSQLRSRSAAADVQTLVHEISLILAAEDLAASLNPVAGPKVELLHWGPCERRLRADVPLPF